MAQRSLIDVLAPRDEGGIRVVVVLQILDARGPHGSCHEDAKTHSVLVTELPLRREGRCNDGRNDGGIDFVQGVSLPGESIATCARRLYESDMGTNLCHDDLADFFEFEEAQPRTFLVLAQMTMQERIMQTATHRSIGADFVDLYGAVVDGEYVKNRRDGLVTRIDMRTRNLINDVPDIPVLLAARRALEPNDFGSLPALDASAVLA